METEWDDSGRKRRDGQKKKIGKANEKKIERKYKIAKDEKVNKQRRKGGTPAPHRGRCKSHLYRKPKQVLNLATPEGCKAELTYVT